MDPFSILSMIVGEFWPYIAGAVGLAVVFLFGKKSGKSAAERKNLERRIDAIGAKKEIDNEVESLPDPARRDELGRFVRAKPKR